MKFYLASRYGRRLELLGYIDQIEAAGHEVTSRWLKDTKLKDQQWNEIASIDLEDLDRSDCIIVFTESPEFDATGASGRHVEHGYALHRGMKIIIVGHRENVFCRLPDLWHYPDWEAFKAGWFVEQENGK